MHHENAAQPYNQPDWPDGRRVIFTLAVMTSTYFRALILVSVVTGLAGSFVDLLLPSLVPASLSAAVDNEPIPPFLSESPWVSLLLFAPISIAGVVSTIGLYFFRQWARTLSVGVLCMGFAVTPFIGATLSSGLSYALIEFAATTWGATLALAYFSPISSRFVIAGVTHGG